MERGEEVDLLVSPRRSFLIDMAWPVGSDAIARMFDLPAASEDVQEAEIVESTARMQRFTDRGRLCALLALSAADCMDVLALVEDREEAIAWLATYALAVMNLLESAGEIEVTPV